MAGDQGVTASALARGRWRLLPAAPIPDRSPAIPVDGSDGWAYALAADRWSVLPPAPGQPVLGEVLVWTGREVISVAGRHYAAFDGEPGGRYDPARNRWQRLAAGPLDGAAGLVGLWTGAALLVWNGNSSQRGCDPATGFEPGDGAAWDPAADRWVRLPRSPLGAGDGAVAVWTGRAALIWGEGRGSWRPTISAWSSRLGREGCCCHSQDHGSLARNSQLLKSQVAPTSSRSGIRISVEAYGNAMHTDCAEISICQ